MPEPTDRRWTDADRELVVSVLWTCACQGNNAGPALDPQPAAEAPMHMWGDAAAVLDALAAAGRLADPQELERLRKAERERDSLARRCDRLAATIRAMPDAIANSAANLAHARQERDDLRARVAELEAELDGAHADLERVSVALDRATNNGLPAAQQPDRWELPAEPEPEVTQVWDVEGVQWTRQHPSVDRWVCDEDAVWQSVRTWGDLLPRGPLSATPPETAGGGQA